MKRLKLWLAALVLAAPLAACKSPDGEEKASQELNVNSRYTVESVRLLGADLKISNALRREVDRIVGAKYDLSAIEDLADHIKSELHLADIKISVTRGTTPDHVIVNLEARQPQRTFDLYVSKEGWNGDGAATVNLRQNAVTFGLVSDNDTLVERYAGIRAQFERKSVGTDRLRLRFEFASFHTQWNEATLAAAPLSEIYRTRQVFMPEATVVILPPLEWSFGASFDRLGVPFSSATVGGAAAAKTESSNAV